MNPVQIQMHLGDEDIVMLDLHGRLSRDGWMGSMDPISAACGESIYTRKVMLNLADANYLDSTGVEWLLVSNEKFKTGGGRLVLHSASRMTSEFLKMMRMHLVLDLVADEAAARARLSNSSNGSHHHA